MKRVFWLIWFSVILGQLVRLPGGGVLSDILVPLYLGWFLVKYSKKISWNVFLFGWLGFLSWLVVGLLINLDNLPFEGAFQSSLYLIRLGSYFGILIPWTYWYKQDKINTLKMAWKMIVTSGLVVAVLGFLQLILIPDFSFMTQYGWDPHQGRLLSTWYDPNFVGAFLGITLLLIVSKTIILINNKETPWNKFFFLLLGIIVSGSALLLTYSRSALLATIISLSILSLFKSRKTFIVIMLILSLIVFANPRLQTRIQGAIQIDVTASLRIESWLETLDDIADNPWIGIGYNTIESQNIVPEQLNSSAGRDSSLLTLWMTGGVFSLILYLGLVIGKLIQIAVRTTESNYEEIMKLATISSWILILSHSWFVNSLFYPHLLIPTLILLAL